MITYVPDTCVPITLTRQKSLETHDFWCRILSAMRTEVIGLNGGSKQFWLRMHRKDVEQFYYANGPEATMAEFNIYPDTLERFLARKGREERSIQRLSDSDRYVLRMAMESNRDLKRRLADLEVWREEVEPVIQVTQALINAATRGIVKGKVANVALPSNDYKRAEIVESRKVE